MIDSFTGKYKFLSNFYPCEVTWCDTTYPTVEHAYQALKTLDLNERTRISRLGTPGKAKRAGRLLELRSDWEMYRMSFMFRLLKQKFADPKLKKLLFDTGSETLVERNVWGDTFWGRCGGEGQNWLGRMLMILRDEAIII